MTRKEFYKKYYDETNRAFADKTVWSREEREEADRKGQHLISKRERKINLAVQYLCLLLCWVPLCFDKKTWVLIPCLILIGLLNSALTNFSFLKIELLYRVHQNGTVYGSLLHDAYFGNHRAILDKLRFVTKRSVTGYSFRRRGIYRATLEGYCRSPKNSISVTFLKKSVKLEVNGQVTVIDHPFPTREELFGEMATVINGQAPRK